MATLIRGPSIQELSRQVLQQVQALPKEVEVLAKAATMTPSTI
jgi:hypothetical protein